MRRRSFVGSCAAAAAGLPWGGALGAYSQPRAYARVLLTDAAGRPLRASQLKPLVTYLFHYPYRATPVFLLNMDRPIAPLALHAAKDADLGSQGAAYLWPGGVGPAQSLVAYVAICTHGLSYPDRDVSFINFRKGRARRGVQDRLIHCCADQSQYDPAEAASVLAGPAQLPLSSVLLAYDAREDTLSAYATLGPEVFQPFFSRHAAKLDLDPGPPAQSPVTGQARVWEMDRYCRNMVMC